MTRLELIQKQLRVVRRRIACVLLAFGIGASLTWHFQAEIIRWLLAPAGDNLSPTGLPVFLAPTEMFSLAVGLAMKGGMIAAAPVLVYNVARFLRPILSKQQKKFIAIFLPAGFLCYLGGTAFAYYVILPTGLGFLLAFGTDVATPMIRITEYMTLAMAMLFWLGVVFELPLAMFLLAKLRIVTYEKFKRIRRYVPAMAFILSAIITPTFDIVNQTLVAVPIILLYEAGVFLAWMAGRKRHAA